MPFVKLDTNILDSTLWVDRDLREVFITALLMAAPREFTVPQRQIKVDSLETTEFCAPPDWYGFVPSAGVGIINRAGVDRAAGMDALRKLGEPESESRSKDFDGRRMIRVDGGFLLLTYMKHRDRDHSAADRQKRMRERKKKRSGNTSPVTRDVNDVTRDMPVTSRIAESREQKAEGERPPTPREPETASEPLKTPHSALTPLTSLIGPPRGNGAQVGGNAAQVAAPQTTTPDEIPEGLAPVQYGFYILETLAIPASYGLRVKLGDAIEMLARVETCPMSEATQRMLARMQTAAAQGPCKWNFWLEDGEWKQGQLQGVSTEGWEQ